MHMKTLLHSEPCSTIAVIMQLLLQVSSLNVVAIVHQLLYMMQVYHAYQFNI